MSVSFASNNASYGGAIFAENCSILLDPSHNSNSMEFQGNSAYLFGGAIYLYKGGLVVEPSEKQAEPFIVFDSNSASYGGALALYSVATSQFRFTSFENNQGTVKAGAVSLENVDAAIFESCNFTSNTAPNLGGAFDLVSSNLTVWDSIAQANKVTAESKGGFGGFASLFNTSLVHLKTGVTLSNSTATGGGGVFYFNDKDSYSTVPTSPSGLIVEHSSAEVGGIAFCEVDGNHALWNLAPDQVSNTTNKATIFPFFTPECNFTDVFRDKIPPPCAEGKGYHVTEMNKDATCQLCDAGAEVSLLFDKQDNCTVCIQDAYRNESYFGGCEACQATTVTANSSDYSAHNSYLSCLCPQDTEPYVDDRMHDPGKDFSFWTITQNCSHCQLGFINEPLSHSFCHSKCGDAMVVHDEKCDTTVDNSDFGCSNCIVKDGWVCTFLHFHDSYGNKIYNETQCRKVPSFDFATPDPFGDVTITDVVPVRLVDVTNDYKKDAVVVACRSSLDTSSNINCFVESSCLVVESSVSDETSTVTLDKKAANFLNENALYLHACYLRNESSSSLPIEFSSPRTCISKTALYACSAALTYTHDPAPAVDLAEGATAPLLVDVQHTPATEHVVFTFTVENVTRPDRLFIYAQTTQSESSTTNQTCGDSNPLCNVTYQGEANQFTYSVTLAVTNDPVFWASNITSLKFNVTENQRQFGATVEIKPRHDVQYKGLNPVFIDKVSEVKLEVLFTTSNAVNVSAFQFYYRFVFNDSACTTIDMNSQAGQLGAMLNLTLPGGWDCGDVLFVELSSNKQQYYRAVDWHGNPQPLTQQPVPIVTQGPGLYGFNYPGDILTLDNLSNINVDRTLYCVFSLESDEYPDRSFVEDSFEATCRDDGTMCECKVPPAFTVAGSQASSGKTTLYLSYNKQQRSLKGFTFFFTSTEPELRLITPSWGPTTGTELNPEYSPILLVAGNFYLLDSDYVTPLCVFEQFIDDTSELKSATEVFVSETYSDSQVLFQCHSPPFSNFTTEDAHEGGTVRYELRVTLNERNYSAPVAFEVSSRAEKIVFTDFSNASISRGVTKKFVVSINDVNDNRITYNIPYISATPVAVAGTDIYTYSGTTEKVVNGVATFLDFQFTAESGQYFVRITVTDRDTNKTITADSPFFEMTGCEEFLTNYKGGCVCMKGYFMGEDSTCHPCALNYYKSDISRNYNDVCQACEISDFLHTNSVGSENCTCLDTFQDNTGGVLNPQTSAPCVCAPGYEPFTENEEFLNASVCVECPYGSFKSGYNLDSCTRCSSLFGTSTTKITAATSADDCVCIETYQWFTNSTDSSTLCSCPPGTREEENTCVSCSLGTFQGEWGQQTCLSCNEFMTTLEAGNTASSACVCREGYYKLAETDENCVACPVCAVCELGANYPITDSGCFLVTDGNKLTGAPPIYDECDNEDACVGGADNACAEGYEDYKCSTCSNGYYKVELTCNKCANWSSILLPMGIVAFMCAMAFVYKVNFRPDRDAKFGALRIAFNFFQVTGLYASFEIDWPESVQSMLNTISITNLNIELTAPECSVGQHVPFYTKYWLMASLPGIFGVCFAFYYLCMRLWIRFFAVPFANWRQKGIEEAETNKTSIVLRDDLFQGALRSFLVMLIIAYVPLTSYGLKFLDCRIQKDGLYHLDVDTSIECYTGEYLAQMVFALPIAGLYIVGIPFLFLFTLWRNRQHLATNSTFYAKMGFLYARYIRSKYWWEIGILFRKILVVFCLRFLNTDSSFQVFSALLFQFVFLVLQVMWSPFRVTLLNQLETGSLCVSLLTLLIGNVFLSSQSDSMRGFLVVVIFMIFIVNIVFFLFVIVIELRTTLKERSVHHKTQSERKRLEKTTVNHNFSPEMEMDFAIGDDEYEDVTTVNPALTTSFDDPAFNVGFEGVEIDDSNMVFDDEK
eukprot:GCRY01001578.1.p1 GENE.GCRY01001578.1~~GCRY01001578.1.p1  ORF type:complete len:1943 (-),score=491.87 GCRY01001578.1:352-6105(-)